MRDNDAAALGDGNSPLDPTKKLSQTHNSRNAALEQDSSGEDLRLPGDISSINSMSEDKQR